MSTGPTHRPEPALHREQGRELAILYRGELSSCNYDCSYCPFAKRRDPSSVLERDRLDLERFVEWARTGAAADLSVLFTPWGEALTRPWYRDAMVTLSHLPNVRRVAAQTNLSWKLDWVEHADLSSLAFWATYHPTEVSLDQFLAKCRGLREDGVRFSVGIVGFDHHLDDARELRSALPDDVYLWVNAPEETKGTLTGQELADQISTWSEIDPLFAHNTVAHETLGQPCQAGDTAISVAGDGTVRPCHFVDRPLGNLYEPGFLDLLGPSRCPNRTCDCHIGYVHLDRLGLRNTFAAGVLERIPATNLWRR